MYGEYRTGKTQLAHTMSVVAQLPAEYGGAAGKVAYIDTEGSLPSPLSRGIEMTWFIGTFRPDRIRSIADRFGVDATMALENILYGMRSYAGNATRSADICGSSRVQQRAPG